MKNYKIVLLGFGNAGQEFARLLQEKLLEIRNQFQSDVNVVAITTKSRGNLIYNDGIDLEKACSDIKNLGKFDKDSAAYSDHDSMWVVENVDYDILIEATPLEIRTGQPAINHIKGALARKKHVITANKGPIAWSFAELRTLAEEQHCLFYYETTVMDGTPIFNLKDETLRLCKVLEVEGILNTTTNYVLEELEKGLPYDQIIEEGKRRGFVEADPSLDIEGWDAAAKLTALLNVLMDANITPNEIDRSGIENITLEDIRKASEKGKRIKLLCRGTIDQGKVVASVKPVEIAKDKIYSTVDSTSSIISITTDLMGKLSIVEHNPEIQQTAYGIFSDLLRVIISS